MKKVCGNLIEIKSSFYPSFFVDDKVAKQQLDFIKQPEILKLLDANDFDQLYREHSAAFGSSLAAGYLTEILMMSDIDFLSYLTTLPKGCFNFLGDILSVTLPDNIKKIRGYNFYGCRSLKKVILPDSLEAIEISTFDSCFNLEEIWYKGKSYDAGDILVVLEQNHVKFLVEDE